MALEFKPITELEAVNYMLESIGEQPTNSLDSAGVSEVSIAQTMLHNISREVQQIGLLCNSEEKYPLPISVEGFVYIPDNTLKVDASDPNVDVCQRGNRMYDKKNHTFVFTKPLEVDITFFLPFTDLPQVVRDYITIRAARQFQIKTLGSETLASLTARDEEQARLALYEAEIDNGDYSIFDNFTSAEMLRRH